MENFGGILKKRIIALTTFSIIATLLVASVGYWGYSQIGNSTHIDDFMHGAQSGLFAGFLIMMLRDIVKYIRAIKDENKIKAIYIEENDERKKLIKDKIGGVGFDFIIGVMMVAVVIAGFFNKIVFLTLLGALSFMAFVKLSLKLYYNRKY